MRKLSQGCSRSWSASHCLSDIGLTDVEGIIGLGFVSMKCFCRLSLVLQEGITTTNIPFPLLRGRLVSISPVRGTAPRLAICPKLQIRLQCIRLSSTLDYVAASRYMNPLPLGARQHASVIEAKEMASKSPTTIAEYIRAAPVRG